jgi:hypothetical protein
MFALLIGADHPRQSRAIALNGDRSVFAEGGAGALRATRSPQSDCLQCVSALGGLGVHAWLLSPVWAVGRDVRPWARGAAPGGRAPSGCLTRAVGQRRRHVDNCDLIANVCARVAILQIPLNLCRFALLCWRSHALMCPAESGACPVEFTFTSKGTMQC